MSFPWQRAPQKRLACTDARRKLSADKWDLVLGFSSIYWWVLLAEGTRYHGGFLLRVSLADWIPLQRAAGIWSRRGAVKLGWMGGTVRRGALDSRWRKDPAEDCLNLFPLSQTSNQFLSDTTDRTGQIS